MTTAQMREEAADIFERFGRWLQRTWDRPLRCMLGAHDDMGHMTSDRWYLECQGCGRETPGFDLAAKPPRQSC